MATGRVTTAADIISPKNPAGLRVIFIKPAGNKVSLALSDISDFDYITKEMLEGAVSPMMQPVELSYPSTTSLPITITATEAGEPLIDFGRFPKIRVLLDAGINNINTDLPGFTVGTIELVMGTPHSIVVDDGSGALAYDIIVIISQE